MCILLNVKKHEKTFALNVDIFRRMRNKKNFPYEKSYVILYKLTELRAKANKYIVLRGAGKWRIPCVRKLQKRREAS